MNGFSVRFPGLEIQRLRYELTAVVNLAAFRFALHGGYVVYRVDDIVAAQAASIAIARHPRLK